MWIIDFGVNTPVEEAMLYEAPFEYVKDHVEPIRSKVRRESYATKWWLHVEPCSGMRTAIEGLGRYVATPTTSKHRLFVWLPSNTLPDHALIAFARDDDYFFGLLQSSVHELWARGLGTQLREVESGFRYTPTTTFETFPLPERPATEAVAEVETTARTLCDLRAGWLEPPGLGAAELEKRTLTNLYNQRPTWLTQAHERLDRAVHAAYAWEWPLDDDEVLSRLLEMNLARAGELVTI
jgi:hypothetical protein